MSAEDPLAFIKDIKSALLEQRKGAKRERETEEKKKEQKSDAQPPSAKKAKKPNVNDTIRAINDIYSEKSKIPEAIKHMLVNQVCQSSGWTVDPAVFTSSSQQAPIGQPIGQPADASSSQQEQVVSPPVFPVAGQEPVGQPIAQQDGQQPIAQPIASTLGGQQPPAQQPPAQQETFDLSSFTAQEKRNALDRAFASRRQASDPSAASN